MNNITLGYNYDDRLRVAKETKTINGNEFETSYVYDSIDRVISKDGFGTDIDYLFNEQGKVRKIPGFITDSHYNAFGGILNRSYANNLVASFSYDSENNRLTNILISGVQDLSYTYDNVGNIITITDSVQNKLHSLTYDNLDRMTRATIGSDRYVYSYNALGNIMKIVKNNESKKFVYSNLAHAPSRIIEGNAGADVYNPTALDTGSKNRTYEFFLVNDKDTPLTNVNVTVDFGDGNSFSDQNLGVDDNIMFLVQNDYSNGGDYVVNVSAASTGIRDYQEKAVKFGLKANNMSILDRNVSKTTFEFVMDSDIQETIYNVHWNCSDGIDSTIEINLKNGESISDYIQHNYTFSGDKTFTCTGISQDGIDSKTIEFTIKGLEIDNYDILSTNISRKIIGFEAKNHFNPAEANISVDAENSKFSTLVNIPTNDNVMVFAEVNYSSDGPKNLQIGISSDNVSESYTDSFSAEGVGIENYNRVNVNSTKDIIMFDVRNNWYAGNVVWELNNPSITNTTYLDNDETVFVFIANNYTAEQGYNKVEVNATISSFVDYLRRNIETRPLKILSLQTLSEGLTAVSELVVRNNLNLSQQFSWKFNSGVQNISSNDVIDVLGEDVFVFIESNYSDEDVHKTRALINSSNYNDSETGVIIS